MNKFDELQKNIKAKYPSFKSLPLLTRLKIKFTEYPTTCTDSFEEGTEKYSQTYRIYKHNNAEYFYKFGW